MCDDGPRAQEEECWLAIARRQARSMRQRGSDKKVSMVGDTWELLRCFRRTYLFLLTLSGTRGLDAVSAFDNICFEAYRTRATVELEEKAAGVTEYRADFISSP